MGLGLLLWRIHYNAALRSSIAMKNRPRIYSLSCLDLTDDIKIQRGIAFLVSQRLTIVKYCSNSAQLTWLAWGYLASNLTNNLHFGLIIGARGGVEDTRLEAKAKDTKKIRGQGQVQPFRGQTLSRPRRGMLEAKDTGASALQKKKVFKNIFQAISNSLAYPEFLIGGGLNHKSHEMTSSKFFQRESTCGTKLS